MSHSQSKSNNLQMKTDAISNQYAYQFNPTIYPQTIDQSNSTISIAAMKTLSPENKRKFNFSYKEFEPKNYSSHYLCPSNSNKSISTGISFNNHELPSHRSRQLQRNNSSRYDVNKRITTQMIEETRQEIQEKMNTIDNIMRYVETEGFGRYHKEISKRKQRILSIEIKTNTLNSGVKSMKKDENNLIVSNGKLYTECSINSQRTKSYQRGRINKNAIISVEVELPQCEQKIKKEKQAKMHRTEEYRKLSKETTQLSNKIKTMTMAISDQQKEKERIREQIHLVHKQIAAVKEKIEFYDDANEKAINNVYRLITDKSLYYQDKKQNV